MGFCESKKEKLILFSTETLPVYIKEFGQAVAESLQVSPGMVGPALLAAISLGIQNKYCAHPLPDWYEPANLYIIVVAEPSERKSPALKEIAKPIFDYEKSENERLAPEIALYETKKKVLQQQISNVEKSLSNTSKKKRDDKYLDMGDLVALHQELNGLEEVSPVSIVVDNVTMESLAVLLQQNKESIGIMSSEGGIFNILAGAYSDNPVIDIMLKGYSGDRFVSSRIGRKGQLLEHPLITMLLYVQPVVIKEIMENSSFLGRGLDARFAYSIPQSTIGRRKYEVNQIDGDIRRNYEDIIRRLYEIPVPDKPKPIDLDEDAHKLAEQFFYEIDNEAVDASPEYKAWLGKLHGLCMRLTLCLHCAEYVEESENHKINADTIRRGIEIARYFREHAKAAFDIMGLMDPPVVRDAKYIMARIDSMGQMEIKSRDLHRLCMGRKGMETREDIIPGLNYLVERGFIRIQKLYLTDKIDKIDTTNKIDKIDYNNKKRGRPSEIIYVNPEYIKWKEERK